MPIFSIDTIGRGGSKHSFEGEYEHETNRHGEIWRYSIMSQERPTELFEARFKTLGDTRIRVAVIDRHFLEEFSAKGIPEALFEHVVNLSGRTLFSSVGDGGAKEMTTDFDPDGFESRNNSADKMWKRLVAANRAQYDGTEDRYVFLANRGHD